MDKTLQKKINRNNRKRGGAFEKWGADFLDMDVVPYSGSNARFGYGDVRDSVWLGEFKNITPDDNGKVVIEMKWIDKNNDRAISIGHKPFLAWMPSGKVTKYIIIGEEELNLLSDPSLSFFVEIPKKSCKSVNIIINILLDKWLSKMYVDHGIIRLSFDNKVLYMMRMEYFKKLINERGLKGNRSGI